MNCKPGDLAIVTNADGSGWVGEVSRRTVGRIVRVMKLRPSTSIHCSSPIVWEIEQPITGTFALKPYEVTGIADSCLRPIRDPGDDATDESHAWLPPVPTTTKELA
jgi:hypothetical protein